MINIDAIKKNKWILCILLIATILRFYHLDFQSLWLDEIYTMNVSNPRLSWLEFHQQLLKREGFPHFYFGLLRITYTIFGYTSVVARSVSAFAGIGCVYAIYLIGKELNNVKIGLVAAFLVAVNEYQIYISQDARPYSLYFLAATLSFYRLIIFIKNSNLRTAILYGIFTGILLNINFFGIINVFSQSLIILFFFLLKPKKDKINFLKTAFFSGLIALIMFAPNYLMLNKLLKFKGFWVKPPAADSFSLIFKKFFGDWEITWFIIIVLILFYIVTIFQHQEKKQITFKNILADKTIFGFIILFGWFFVFFSFLAIKSYEKISYLLTRYFISISPVLFLILSIAINKVKSKIVKKIVFSALIFLTLANLIYVKKYYSKCSQTQFRELSFNLIKQNKTNEKVFTEYKYWYDYYFNQKQSETVNISLDKLIAQMKKNPKKLQSFWYIGLFKKPYNPSVANKEFLDKHFIIDKNLNYYQVWGKHFVLKK
jgi:mannosyltransferase